MPHIYYGSFNQIGTVNEINRFAVDQYVNTRLWCIRVCVGLGLNDNSAINWTNKATGRLAAIERINRASAGGLMDAVDLWLWSFSLGETVSECIIGLMGIISSIPHCSPVI